MTRRTGVLDQIGPDLWLDPSVTVNVLAILLATVIGGVISFKTAEYIFQKERESRNSEKNEEKISEQSRKIRKSFFAIYRAIGALKSVHYNLYESLEGLIPEMKLGALCHYIPPFPEIWHSSLDLDDHDLAVYSEFGLVEIGEKILQFQSHYRSVFTLLVTYTSLKKTLNVMLSGTATPEFGPGLISARGNIDSQNAGLIFQMMEADQIAILLFREVDKAIEIGFDIAQSFDKFLDIEAKLLAIEERLNLDETKMPPKSLTRFADKYRGNFYESKKVPEYQLSHFFRMNLQSIS